MAKLGKKNPNAYFQLLCGLFLKVGDKIAPDPLLQMCTVSRPGKTKLRMPVPINRLGRWVAKLRRWVA
jgi:hypothetical protein